VGSSVRYPGLFRNYQDQKASTLRVLSFLSLPPFLNLRNEHLLISPTSPLPAPVTQLLSLLTRQVRVRSPPGVFSRIFYGPLSSSGHRDVRKSYPPSLGRSDTSPFPWLKTLERHLSFPSLPCELKSYLLVRSPPPALPFLFTALRPIQLTVLVVLFDAFHPSPRAQGVSCFFRCLLDRFQVMPGTRSAPHFPPLRI